MEPVFGDSILGRSVFCLVAVAPGLCWHFVNEQGRQGCLWGLGHDTALLVNRLRGVVTGTRFSRLMAAHPVDMLAWLGRVFSERPAVLLPQGWETLSVVPWRLRCQKGRPVGARAIFAGISL